MVSSVGEVTYGKSESGRNGGESELKMLFEGKKSVVLEGTVRVDQRETSARKASTKCVLGKDSSL